MPFPPDRRPPEFPTLIAQSPWGSAPPQNALHVLVVIAGADAGRQHALVKVETTIGRGGDQEFILADVASSRRHVIITREGQRYRITDLGSSNGTLVNGERAATTLLNPGDLVRIGSTVLRLDPAPTWDDDALSIPSQGYRPHTPPPAPAPAPPPPSVAPPASFVPAPVPLTSLTASAELSLTTSTASAELSRPEPGRREPRQAPYAPAPSAPIAASRPAAATVMPPPRAPAPPDRESFDHEPTTGLVEGALLEELPPDPVQATPIEVPLPEAIVARMESGWSVRVGEVLSAGHEELGTLMEECSGLSFARGRLIAAHAHADFIEFIDPATLTHERVELPRVAARMVAGLRQGAELQIEAVLAARDYRGDFLLAFGAGSTPERRRIVRMRISAGELDLAVMDTPWLYDSLLGLPGFATSTLNLEGAAWIRPPDGGAPYVRLCQRGNGKPRGRATPTSATVDILQVVLVGYLERCRRNPNSKLGDDLCNMRRYDLGTVSGVPLAISDACGLEGGRMLYVAVAELSSDVGISGPNFGTAIGLIEIDGSARQALVCEADGTPTTAKVAAVTVDDAGQVYMALQPTDSHGPRLCRLALAGVPI
ncbi:MAG: FHA domain-containing protein [Myxococcales bacterium]|nr:FHA domain-containing protein [Myxococcales bacterium]